MQVRGLMSVAAIGVAATAATTVGHSAAVPATAAPLGKPNIVVIMADDQRWDDMDVMTKTTALIGDRGVRFTNAYTSYPLCAPSRSTLLTGQYSHHHGVVTNGETTGGGYAALDSTNTLPVWLKAAGYDTVHIGKYVNGYGNVDKDPAVPDEQEIPPGWTDWQGLIGKSTYQYYGYQINDNGHVVTYGTSDADYQTDVVSARAVDAVRRHAASGTPFFMEVTPLAPHRNNRGLAQPAPRDRGVLASMPFVPRPSYDEKDLSDKPTFMQSKHVDKPPLQAVETRREAMLGVDDLVGSVIDALGASGVLDNTYVIYTSDNGFFYGEHGLTSKGEVYEEALRAPLVIRGPRIRPGTVAPQPVVNVDLAPTIVDMADATAGRAMDGRSMMPLIGFPSYLARRGFLVESGPDPLVEVPYRAVHTNRYVWVDYATGEHELYDLAVDPYQMDSKHDDPAYATVRAALEADLQRLIAGHDAEPDLAWVVKPTATTGRVATFSWTVDEPEAKVTCTLDGKAAPCASPLRLSKLAPGSHRLSLVAKDAADLRSRPLSVTWTVVARSS